MRCPNPTSQRHALVGCTQEMPTQSLRASYLTRLAGAHATTKLARASSASLRHALDPPTARSTRKSSIQRVVNPHAISAYETSECPVLILTEALARIASRFAARKFLCDSLLSLDGYGVSVSHEESRPDIGLTKEFIIRISTAGQLCPARLRAKLPLPR